MGPTRVLIKQEKLFVEMLSKKYCQFVGIQINGLTNDGGPVDDVFCLKLCRNKKGQKNFQMHCFRCLFLQLAAEKKSPKTVHLEKFSAYLVTALVLN